MGLPIILIIFLCNLSQAFDLNHTIWTAVLQKYQIPDGRIQYRPLKSDFDKEPAHPLKAYLKELESLSQKAYEQLKREHQMAFLINSYNAQTIKLILDNYPVSGIKKTVGFLKSPWKKEFFSLLEGTLKSLDPIEHDILRPKFKDARVHAAVNCASLSCPKLQPVAFTGEKLEAQLEAAFSEFLNDPFRNRYEPQSGTLYLSEIFKWFGDDFTTYGGYLKAIEKLGPATAKEAIQKGAKIKWISYNWDLNDAATENASST